MCIALKFRQHKKEHNDTGEENEESAGKDEDNKEKLCDSIVNDVDDEDDKSEISDACFNEMEEIRKNCKGIEFRIKST